MGSSLAVGLASQPGAGGLSVALLETDGNRHIAMRDRLRLPYTAGLQDLLDAAVEAAAQFERPVPDAIIAEADAVFTSLCLSGVESIMRKAGLARTEIDLIGLHGHALAHRPARSWSWRLGDAQKLAQLIETDVISSFADADLSVGGTGSPLNPVFHRALLLPASFPAALLALDDQPMLTLVNAKGAVSARLLDDASSLAEQIIAQVPDDASLIVTGTGDEALIAQLDQRRSVPCWPGQRIGIDPDYQEAECAAYLAVRHLAMLPVSFPETTGAPYPVGAGVRHFGRETGLSAAS